MNYEPDPTITEYNGIKIGDIVTTYHKGYFKIIGFQYYDNNKNNEIQAIYHRVADTKGKLSGSQNKSCHYSRVERLDSRSLDAEKAYEIYKIELKYQTLHNMIRKLESKYDES